MKTINDKHTSRAISLPSVEEPVVWLTSNFKEAPQYKHPNFSGRPIHQDRYPQIDLGNPALARMIMPALLAYQRDYKARTGALNPGYVVKHSVHECLGPEFAQHYSTNNRQHSANILARLKELAAHPSASGHYSTADDPSPALQGLQTAHDFLFAMVDDFNLNLDHYLRQTRQHGAYTGNHADHLRQIQYLSCLARDFKLYVCHGECPKIDTFMKNALAVEEVARSISSITAAVRERQQDFISLANKAGKLESELEFTEACEQRKQRDAHQIETCLQAAKALLEDIRANAFSLPDINLVQTFRQATDRYLNSTLDDLLLESAKLPKKPERLFV